MTTALDLAKLIEASMKQHDLTRLELKDKAGISRTALFRLMNGQDVQVSTLLAVLDALKLDLAGLPRAIARGLPELGTTEVSGADGPTPFNRQRFEVWANRTLKSEPVMSAVRANAAKLLLIHGRTVPSREPLKATFPPVLGATGSVSRVTATGEVRPNVDAQRIESAQPADDGDSPAPISREDGTP